MLPICTIRHEQKEIETRQSWTAIPSDWWPKKFGVDVALSSILCTVCDFLPQRKPKTASEPRAGIPLSFAQAHAQGSIVFTCQPALIKAGSLNNFSHVPKYFLCNIPVDWVSQCTINWLGNSHFITACLEHQNHMQHRSAFLELNIPCTAWTRIT